MYDLPKALAQTLAGAAHAARSLEQAPQVILKSDVGL